jgi:hypothetical protein
MTKTWDDTRCKNLLMDPAEQLQKLYMVGFDVQTFDRFPKAVAVVRDQCIALLVVTPEGLRLIGTPGWRMGEVMGVLTEKDGRQIFQFKSESVDATPERLAALQKFRSDLEEQLLPSA